MFRQSADSDDISYFNLSSHHRLVTTGSKDAQVWFERGLIWSFSFNHEAVRCFERAAEYDPCCAMAFWGFAYAAGPNYNKAWKFFDPKNLRIAIERAKDAMVHAAKLAVQASG
ncbi:uncharacterized protein LDX57_002765 [Aspergillus melleus]|uniref:uncharacterized protein n=1 Tax=Aspergillus melleus TaxID=138277 RepID=UPI001E8E383B|nr:uncharacterized protein LDX57_002765 [Aspergillus melleus]KAH8425019.1 hypothetical protein LDX57_002765 [Aspergillus melleus]